MATVHSSFKSRYRTWLEVGGKDGILQVSEPFKQSAPVDIVLSRGDASRVIRVEAPPLLYVRQIEDFAAAVFDGRPPQVSLAESRGNAAAIAALYASARAGNPVTVS
jgi:predicted dehydrogenase